MHTVIRLITWSSGGFRHIIGIETFRWLHISQMSSQMTRMSFARLW